MLPTADAAWVAAELARRFGLPAWQFALSATDANRFALRLARHRHRAAAGSSCSTGATTAPSTRRWSSLDADGPRRAPATARSASPVDPALTTAVVPFNDVDALEPPRSPAGTSRACWPSRR